MRFTTILLLILLAIIVVAFMGWSRVPGIIETNLTKKMGVPVTIGHLGIAPAKITVDDITIGNARGYTKLPRAFSAQQTSIKAPVTRYLKKEIIIEEIKIENIYLGLEFDSSKGTNGNWTAIMSNLKGKKEHASNPEKDRKVFIKKIIFTNIKTDLVYIADGGGVKHLPTIPYMELNNISSSGEDLADQIADSVLGKMLKDVFVKQNMQNMFKDFLDPTQDGSPLQPIFKGLFP